MELKEIVIKELENMEFDIHQAANQGEIEQLEKQAIAHIYAAEKSELFPQDETEYWRKRINQVIRFRTAELEWSEGK